MKDSCAKRCEKLAEDLAARTRIPLSAQSSLPTVASWREGGIAVQDIRMPRSRLWAEQEEWLVGARFM